MEKKIYITSSIFYVNSAPHVGSALEMVQTDVLARYHRKKGNNVFLLTGTDEYGVKIVRKAEELNKKTEELVNENSAKFLDLTKCLNISNDDFIRTTDKQRHWPSVHKIWQLLEKNGDIYKGDYKGLYCVGCEAYINKKDLIDDKCPIHKKEPDILEEQNYFFKLSKYIPEIKKIIEEDKIKIIPEARKNEILGLINQGVEDISVSRPKEKLAWGIPVPNDDSQIIYVWLEALINYISALGYDKEDEGFKQFWPADIHCIGKDILRFHSLLWPAVLLSVNLPLPKTIFVHGYLTIEGNKISKSLGNTIDPFELVEKYGIDPVRYFLLREFSSTEDGNFSTKRLEERYNSDLANGLGNLVSRISALSARAEVFLDDRKKVLKNEELIREIKNTQDQHHKAIESIKFNEALESIWKLISICDGYIEKNKPWELWKNDKEKFKEVMSDLLVSIEEILNLLEPFMPETSKRLLGQFKPNQEHEPPFPRL